MRDARLLGQLEALAEKLEIEDMNQSRTFIYVDEKLETKSGLQRFKWDLRSKGAWHENDKRKFKGGPLVPAGKYTVKLVANGQSHSQAFEILTDPRVSEQGVSDSDIMAQYDFQNKVISLLSKARYMEKTYEEILENKNEETPEADIEEVKSILKQLKNDEGAYPQQMLTSQIGYLLNMVSGADQVVGQDALKRYEDLRNELAKLKIE